MHKIDFNNIIICLFLKLKCEQTFIKLYNGAQSAHVDDY